MRPLDMPRHAARAATQGLAVLFCSAVLTSAPVLAQPTSPDWQEASVPAPPPIRLTGLANFDVASNSTMRFGLDPQSLNIGKDGIVRYVVVAVSESGVVNAMYETVRCDTYQVKTFARASGPAAEVAWRTVQSPEWRAIDPRGSQRYAFQLARQGLCQGRAPATNLEQVLRGLKGLSGEHGN